MMWPNRKQKEALVYKQLLLCRRLRPELTTCFWGLSGL